MNRFRASLLVLTLPLTLFAMGAESAAQDHVTIQPRRVVFIRRGKVVRDFPERKKATVRYPIAGGLPDATVLRRIQNTLKMKNVFDSSLEEYRQDTGLLNFDYQVNYNKNYLLDITFTQDAEGAYPDTQMKHFLISLKNGMVIKGADAFDSDSLGPLARLADQKLKVEIRELVKANEEDKSTDTDQKSWVRDQLSKLEFGALNLDEFSISDKGLTFLYDAGFPHAIQALQPNGEYFFSYPELRAYIKSNGPLGIFKH